MLRSKIISTIAERIPVRYQNQFKKIKANLQKNPFNVEAYYQAGELFLKAGIYDVCLDFLEKITALKPAYKDVFFKIGLCEQSCGHWEEALSAYYQHIQYNGKTADVLMNIGAVYFELCQFPMAIFYYKNSLKLNPNNPDIWFNLGEVYEQVMSYQQAVNSYRKYLELNPSDQEIYFLLGKCFVQLSRLDEAEDCYDYLQKRNSAFAPQLRQFIDQDEVELSEDF